VVLLESDMSLLIEKQIIMPLLQAVMLGADHLQLDEVETIVESLLPFGNQYEEIDIALSTIRKNQKKEDESILILRNLVARNEQNWCGKALLAASLFRLGNKQWKILVNEILLKSQDADAQYLAKIVLRESRGEFSLN
jgi:hypothetical protein